MDHVIYFEDLIESILDYKKIVQMFLIENEVDLLNGCGFSKNDINYLSLEF